VALRASMRYHILIPSEEEALTMPQDLIPSWDEVTFSQGQAPFPVPVVTAVAPVGAHQSLYLATADGLYAINAGDGTTRWRQQVKLTRERQV